MSFQTEIQKNISEKVVLVELDIGKENSFWINAAGGVWIVNFNNLYSKLSSFPTVPTVPDIKIVGSVVTNGIQLRRVNLPQTCIETDSSYYFESGTRTLYIHCPNGDNPDLFKVRIGAVFGFRKGGETASYGGVDFQDRVVDISNISVNKDPSFYGVISFDSASVKLINSDGALDLLTRENNVFGNKARILIGFDGWELTDFKQMFEGMIGKIVTDENNISVEFKDARAGLTRNIPVNTLSTSVYPSLNPDNAGKPLPRIFGTCRNVPIFVTDEKKTTGSTVVYNCKISDTAYTSGISAVSAIYVKGIAKTSTGVNLGARTFTLKHTPSTATNKYNPGDEVTADIVGEVSSTGGVIKNGAKVIRQLLKDYYDIDYSNDFYNLSKWDELKSRDVGLYLNEQKPLIDIIGNICSDGIQADFYNNGDGKFSLRIWDSNRAVSQTIQRDQLLETPTITDDPTKVITSTLIGYNKDWNKNEFRLFIDNTNEADIFDKYPVYNQKRFDSLIPTLAGAQDYSSAIFDKSADVETIIQIKVPGWICIEREIGDIVIVYCNRRATEWYRRVKAEITGIDKDLNQHIVSMTLRFLERMDDIPYTESFYYTDNYATPNNRYYGEPNKWYGMTINEG